MKISIGCSKKFKRKQKMDSYDIKYLRFLENIDFSLVEQWVDNNVNTLDDVKSLLKTILKMVIYKGGLDD